MKTMTRSLTGWVWWTDYYRGRSRRRLTVHIRGIKVAAISGPWKETPR